MKATEHKNAPCNQPFNITGNKTNKKGRWNPSSPTYWANKKNK